jgi:hypothetical protein
VVLDDGPGSSAGAVLEADLKHEKKLRVRVVRTGVAGKKAELVDKTRLAVRWGQIKVLDNHLAARLRHELQQFQAIRRVVAAKEVVVYQGPQLHGEHDDCVLSLCLANWGRLLLDEEGPLEEEHDPQEIVQFGEAMLRAHAKTQRNTLPRLSDVLAQPWGPPPTRLPFFPNP